MCGLFSCFSPVHVCSAVNEYVFRMFLPSLLLLLPRRQILQTVPSRRVNLRMRYAVIMFLKASLVVS